MRRLEAFLVEKLNDPEFAAAYWQAESEHPIQAAIDSARNFPMPPIPHLTLHELLALPTAHTDPPTPVSPLTLVRFVLPSPN